ncbi:MAG: 50S ribosomal protein L11 methyltransferase, partial [Dehalococcoidia bacterium]
MPAELVEPVAYLFERYGRGMALEREPGAGLTVACTYLPATAIRSRVRIEIGLKLIAASASLGAPQVRELEEGEWEGAWKAHFTLLRVGQRMVIKPSWIGYTPGDGEVVVELDPGMAFGTGHHPTTRLCLEALEELARPGMTVLDVGTGSGILAIAALKLGVGHLVALDTDPVAVRVAKQNVRSNGLQARARLARGSLPHPLVMGQEFDLVLVNINAKVIQDKAPHLVQAVRMGGSLVASGFLEDHREQLT